MTETPEATKTSHPSTDRERAALQRESEADRRDQQAHRRDDLADDREARADQLERRILLGQRPDNEAVHAPAATEGRRTGRRAKQRPTGQRTTASAAFDEATWAADRREFVADDRQQQADLRDAQADRRDLLADRRDESLRALAVDHGLIAEADAGLESSEERSRRQASSHERGHASHLRDEADAERRAAAAPHPLAAEMAAITARLVTADSLDEIVADVVVAAQRVIAGCAEASFTARRAGSYETLASTGPTALEFDHAQYKADEGPCIEALTTLLVVRSDDFDIDLRWPAFIATRPNHSLRSALSAPVTSGHDPTSTFGSLNSYGSDPGPFDDSDDETALILTAHLGALMALAATLDAANRKADTIAVALETRDVIGQAKGILMERHRLSSGQAFDLLRRASQRLNKKLRDVADELTCTGELHDGVT